MTAIENTGPELFVSVLTEGDAPLVARLTPDQGAGLHPGSRVALDVLPGKALAFHADGTRIGLDHSPAAARELSHVR